VYVVSLSVGQFRLSKPEVGKGAAVEVVDEMADELEVTVVVEDGVAANELERAAEVGLLEFTQHLKSR